MSYSNSVENTRFISKRTSAQDEYNERHPGHGYHLLELIKRYGELFKMR